MKVVPEELIRQRAYEIWEAGGRPHGFEKLHWEQAERELLDAAPEIEERAAAPTTPGASADANASDLAHRRPEQGMTARAAQPVREAPRVR